KLPFALRTLPKRLFGARQFLPLHEFDLVDSSRTSAYMSESRTLPSLNTLARIRPSQTNPAFSRTRTEAALSSNGSAKIRCRSKALNAQRENPRTASDIIPRRQNGSPSQ